MPVASSLIPLLLIWLVAREHVDPLGRNTEMEQSFRRGKFTLVTACILFAVLATPRLSIANAEPLPWMTGGLSLTFVVLLFCARNAEASMGLVDHGRFAERLALLGSACTFVVLFVTEGILVHRSNLAKGREVLPRSIILEAVSIALPWTGKVR